VYTPTSIPVHHAVRQQISFDSSLSGRSLDMTRLSSGGFLGHFVPTLYRLPTVWYNGEIKKSIVDPTVTYRAYELPTCIGRNVKNAPMSREIKDSVGDPLQIPGVAKVTLPYLMTIRHKKMKRHKLKKLRKRMRFLMRKRRAVLQRKKEQAIQEVERKFAKEAAEYDPEKYIEEKMALARRSGWGIDVVSEYSNKVNRPVTLKREPLDGH